MFMTYMINEGFKAFNRFLETFIFFDVLFFMESVQFPLVVLLLFAVSLFLTVKMGFVNIRLFSQALQLVRGQAGVSDNEAAGEISSFKALTTALSGTVGLGNIAGVSLAISTGGPGAAFWMIIMGFLGMSAKFVECSLGVMYREKRPDGRLMGGPMEYLKRGLADIHLKKTGTVLSVLFCVACMGGGLGGGTAFQVNQSLSAVGEVIPFFQNHKWVYGLLLAALVGMVILGGLKRISTAASRIVPFMCLLYLCMVSYVLLFFYDQVPQALVTIVREAFSPQATFGGFMGVMVVGMRRAVFSNEAGLGGAAIAHSAARVKHPVEEGVVALLEPFVDTIVICTMTALLVVVTGVYAHPEHMDLVQGQQGAALTAAALSQAAPAFPYLLTFVVFLFAFSTIISWFYYGERCFCFLFGDYRTVIYKWVVLFIIFVSALAASNHILNFGDLMFLSMAFPNLIGLFLLSGKVKQALKDYQKTKHS